jgi:MFS family permease
MLYQMFLRAKSTKYLPWLMVVLALSFYCYESLLRVSPSVMRMEIMLNYSIDAGTFSSLIAFYYYIYTPMQLFVGVLMDRYGPRKLLTIASLACGVGSYLFVLTNNLLLGEAGRLLIGFGSSFAFVGVLKIASIWLPENKFALISGSTMALGMVGGLIGDTMLTSVVIAEGWKLTMLYAALLGVILAVLIIVIFKDKKIDASEHLEVSTFTDVFAGLKKLLCNSQTWIIGAIGCFMWFPIAIYAEAWGVGHLQDVMGYKIENATFAVGMIFLGMACGGPCVGACADYFQKRKIIVMIGAFLTFIVSSFLIYYDNLSVNSVYALCFFFGFFNSPQVLVFPMAKAITDKHSVGSALALVNMFVMLAGVIQPITGYLLRHIGGNAMQSLIYSKHAYHVALAIIPASLVLTIFLALLLKDDFKNSDITH